MGLTSNGAALLRKMRRRPAAMKRELAAAARELSTVIAAETKKIIQTEIYDVPIPLKKRADEKLSAKAAVRTKTTKGSQGKWSRTGNLKRSETASPDGVNVVLKNNADYAAARSALGGPNPPNNAGRQAGVQRPQAGVPTAQKSRTRSVQWQSQAIENKRTIIVKARRESVLRALMNP